MKNIAVIGGGFSGTMVLYHLMSNESLPPCHILFFDDANRFARGVAYSTPMNEHLLNVPAGGMTALPDQPDHFFNWLGQADRGGFYPRRRYGEYIQQFFDQAQKWAAERGHQITLITERVTNIEKADRAMMVQGHSADIVVLSTGASQPRWPTSKPLPDDLRLIANPYGATFPACLQQIMNFKKIAILGTGLSAADAVMSLNQAGFTGEIICISRHGNWPVAHGLKKPWDWRRLIDVLRPHSNTLWRKMSPGLRTFLLRRIGYWNVVRHRMPRQCHAVLKNLKNAGTLQVIRGSVQDVVCNESGVDVVLHNRTVPCDAVINCLGFIGAGVLGDPLYKALSENGIIRVEDKLLKPVSGTSFKISDSLPLYTLGPPLFGYFIETSAVPELRVQAKAVAGEIAASL